MRINYYSDFFPLNNPVMGQHPIQGSRNIPSHFLQQNRISSGLMSHLACMLTSPHQRHDTHLGKTVSNLDHEQCLWLLWN